MHTYEYVSDCQNRKFNFQYEFFSFRFLYRVIVLLELRYLHFPQLTKGKCKGVRCRFQVIEKVDNSGITERNALILYKLD